MLDIYTSLKSRWYFRLEDYEGKKVEQIVTHVKHVTYPLTNYMEAAGHTLSAQHGQESSLQW